MAEDDARAKLKEHFAKARAELERRRHLRIDARVPISFGSADEFVRAYTENISKGGIFFHTTERLPPNGRLEISLAPPGGEREARVVGRVVRMTTSYKEVDGKRTRLYGYGVRFETVPAAEGEILDRFFQDAKGKYPETPMSGAPAREAPAAPAPSEDAGDEG